jgi:hypothetical protein
VGTIEEVKKERSAAVRNLEISREARTTNEMDCKSIN